MTKSDYRRLAKIMAVSIAPVLVVGGLALALPVPDFLVVPMMLGIGWVTNRSLRRRLGLAKAHRLATGKTS